MTDEEAAKGRGKTEASSILVAMHHGMWMAEGKSKRERKGRSVKSDGSLILSWIPFQHPTIVFLLFLYLSTLVSVFSPLSHLSIIPILSTFIIFYCVLYLFRFLVSSTFPFIHVFTESFIPFTRTSHLTSLKLVPL